MVAIDLNLNPSFILSKKLVTTNAINWVHELSNHDICEVFLETSMLNHCQLAGD